MCETVLQRGWENYREFLEVDIRAKAFARTVREKVILECQWQCAHEQGSSPAESSCDRGRGAGQAK